MLDELSLLLDEVPGNVDRKRLRGRGRKMMREIEWDIRVKLGSATLRTPEEVKVWVAKTEQDLLEYIEQSPIVVN